MFFICKLMFLTSMVYSKEVGMGFHPVNRIPVEMICAVLDV